MKCKGTLYKINGKSYCVGEKKSKNNKSKKSKSKKLSKKIKHTIVKLKKI
jgi:hypothetical protein